MVLQNCSVVIVLHHETVKGKANINPGILNFEKHLNEIQREKVFFLVKNFKVYEKHIRRTSDEGCGYGGSGFSKPLSSF